MAVYVDTLQNAQWQFRRSCHLLADTPEELHALALKLGLKREWAQNEFRGLLHYDLTAGMRAKAVRLGAEEISRRELVGIIRQRRGDYTPGPSTGTGPKHP